jgi:hypothetical protein
MIDTTVIYKSESTVHDIVRCQSIKSYMIVSAIPSRTPAHVFMLICIIGSFPPKRVVVAGVVFLFAQLNQIST